MNKVATITRRNNAATHDLAIVTTDTSDNLTLGELLFGGLTTVAGLGGVFLTADPTLANGILLSSTQVAVKTTAGVERLAVDIPNTNLRLFAGAGGGGQGVVSGHNATTSPIGGTPPSNGGIYWWEGGALLAEGPGGTVTTVAPA
jgi:hypothetical protein